MISSGPKPEEKMATAPHRGLKPRQWRYAAALLLGLLPASPASADPPKISAAEAATIARAEERGRLLYAYDRAAWLGTDDMLAKLPGVAQMVGGWLVDGPADAPELLFYDRDEANPHILYQARLAGGRLAGEVLAPGAGGNVSPARKAMIDATRAARRAFANAGIASCTGGPFNTVVLPPSAPGEAIRVYFLSPQVSNDTIPIGGHYLVEVAAGGQTSAPRPFTRSCLNMPMRPPQGVESPRMVVSHLLDPTPTEIHVFSSLVINMPLIVMTTSNTRGWVVTRGRISLGGAGDLPVSSPPT
jgi:hypothetical protein